MTGWVRIWFFGQWLIVGAMLLLASLTGSHPVLGSPLASGPSMRAFASAAELEAYLAPIRARRRDSPAAMEVAADAAAPAAMPSPAEPAAPADAITNVQTAGVDEGGIVKRRGDILVVLRRGRLFTISTAEGGLQVVDRVNAFPGQVDSNGTWYDEMLISGDQVIVIGYSYQRLGTEISRFRLGEDGALSYRDTWHLRSADYYSDRNYASRLIGSQLIVYAPLPLVGSRPIVESLPALARWTDNGRGARFEPIASYADVHLAAPFWTAPSDDLDVLHSVSSCDLAAEVLDCQATVVLGGWSRNFYVAADAVYLWTHDPRDKDGNLAMLYRMPFDGGKPQAVQVAGSPIDQFSFRADDGMLNVLTADFGGGEAMSSAGTTDGVRLALLRLPLDAFGDGGSTADRAAYRSVPSIKGYALQNRFIGDYLVYGAGEAVAGPAPLPVHAVPLAGGDTTSLAIGHSVTRIDQMAGDAVVIGQDRSGALVFSTIGFDDSPTVIDRYRLPDAGEGESRSHAFFYRPSADGGESGLLGLPVRRRGQEDQFGRMSGAGAAILFLNRDRRRLSPAGQLAASAKAGDDLCLASCFDWYGNARPIFAGERIFALMGYELVEGRRTGDRISELRRLDFTPRRMDRRVMTPQ